MNKKQIQLKKKEKERKAAGGKVRSLNVKLALYFVSYSSLSPPPLTFFFIPHPLLDVAKATKMSSESKKKSSNDRNAYQCTVCKQTFMTTTKRKQLYETN